MGCNRMPFISRRSDNLGVRIITTSSGGTNDGDAKLFLADL